MKQCIDLMQTHEAGCAIQVYKYTRVEPSSVKGTCTTLANARVQLTPVKWCDWHRVRTLYRCTVHIVTISVFIFIFISLAFIHLRWVVANFPKDSTQHPGCDSYWDSINLQVAPINWRLQHIAHSTDMYLYFTCSYCNFLCKFLSESATSAYILLCDRKQMPRHCMLELVNCQQEFSCHIHSLAFLPLRSVCLCQKSLYSHFPTEIALCLI